MKQHSQILAHFNPRWRSEQFRRSVHNAWWSSLDYLVLPVLLVLATPFLVFRLGTAQFGIWMLVNALTGAMGIFDLGLGNATIKYVSAYRARGDLSGVARVMRSTLTVYSFLGLSTASLIYGSAPFLVHRVFKIEPPSYSLAIAAIRIGGVGLALRFGQSVFLAFVQGYERYDLSARVTILVKALTIALLVGVVTLGFGIAAILWVTVIVCGAGAIALALIARSIAPGIGFWPLWNRAALKEVFGFGFYSWLQAIAGTVFAQADLLLIGALLGTTPVAYYSVCQRLAMQIHALLAAGSSFLFPMSSAAAELGNVNRMRSIYRRSLNIITVLAAAMGVPLFLFSKSILTHWMGADFAGHASILLKILAFGYALLASSIVPYNVLNGTGHVRLNTVLGWASVAIVVAASVLLIPSLGLAGVAWAKLANVIPLLAAMAWVHRKVLREDKWSAVLSHFVPIVLPFLLSFLAVGAYGDPKLTSVILLIAMVAGCLVVTLGMAIVVQKLFRLTAVFPESSTN